MTSKFDEYFMRVADETATLSYANRLKVGSVAVRDRRIICCGYNGTAPGECNCCEDDNNKTKPEVLHSEMNLIANAAKNGISLENSTVYITHAPCMTCSILLHASGVSRVFYRNDYRSFDGVNYLIRNKVQITKM